MTNSAKAELKVGDKAPEVTGVTETGQKLNFADVYSKQTYTLVYFFPKADTPGCTAQGCSLRDGYESLTGKGVAVIGVSHDDVAAQKAFKDKYQPAVHPHRGHRRRRHQRFRRVDVPGRVGEAVGVPDQGRQDRLRRLQGHHQDAGPGDPRLPGGRQELTGRPRPQSSSSGAAGRAGAWGSARTRSSHSVAKAGRDASRARATGPPPGRSRVAPRRSPSRSCARAGRPRGRESPAEEEQPGMVAVCPQEARRDLDQARRQVARTCRRPAAAGSPSACFATRMPSGVTATTSVAMPPSAWMIRSFSSSAR